MEQFDALLAQTIDSTLGLRCTMFGYQYSEILRSLMCVYLCGGSCIEDVTTHLMKHLSLHPTLRTCTLICALCWNRLGANAAMLFGAAAIVVLRLLAAYYHWSLPKSDYHDDTQTPTALRN